MTANEEETPSVLDNPVVLDAVTEVISLLDIGGEQGYIDGFEGKPPRNHPTGVPELFKESYKVQYALGVKEREDRKVCKEIARHEKRLGCCREERSLDNVVEPKQVKSVETPAQATQQKEGFLKKYGSAIFGTVVSGIVFGVLGLYVGKVQERKRCMDVKRDIGVPEK